MSMQRNLTLTSRRVGSVVVVVGPDLVVAGDLVAAVDEDSHLAVVVLEVLAVADLGVSMVPTRVPTNKQRSKDQMKTGDLL